MNLTAMTTMWTIIHVWVKITYLLLSTHQILHSYSDSIHERWQCGYRGQVRVLWITRMALCTDERTLNSFTKFDPPIIFLIGAIGGDSNDPNLITRTLFVSSLTVVYIDFRRGGGRAKQAITESAKSFSPVSPIHPWIAFSHRIWYLLNRVFIYLLF